MKKKIFIIVVLLAGSLHAQIGIGTTTPNGILDITSSTQGLLVPRVALTASNSASPVTNPTSGSLVNGTIVYNTATNGSGTTTVTPGFYYWDSANWLRVKSDIYNTPVYGLFTNLSGQTITNSVGSKVAFGTTLASGGVSITYDSTNRVFTLPAGKTYRIDFAVGWINIIGGTFIRFALYNDTTNTKISAVAHCESVANTGHQAGSTAFSHFVTVGSTPLVIGVRTVSGNSANTILGDVEVGPTISIQSID
nr:hypothetical protein [uncultured Flavobacterium sp.]